MSLKKILSNAARLKSIPRTGWVESGIANPESVSEHSYEVAALASIIADNLSLDHSKLVRAALVHDLGESVTGDIPFKTDEQAEKERTALEKILEPLVSKELYLEKLTPEEEAVLKFADNFSMLNQAKEYQKGHKSEKLEQIIKTAKANLKECTDKFPGLKKFL